MKTNSKRVHRVVTTAKPPTAKINSTSASVNLAAVVAEWKESTDRANEKLRAALNLAIGVNRAK